MPVHGYVTLLGMCAFLRDTSLSKSNVRSLWPYWHFGFPRGQYDGTGRLVLPCLQRSICGQRLRGAALRLG